MQLPCAELTRMTDLGCQPHLMSASGRRTRATKPDNSAAMNTSITRENIPAILGDSRIADKLMALHMGSAALPMGSAALAMTAAAVKRQRCNCATAPPWWIPP